MRVKRHPEFEKWLSSIRDIVTELRIARRIERLEHGHFGDQKPVGEGVMELRLQYGPGYRIYYVRHGELLIILLCAGDKSSQAADIRKAKQLAKGDLG